MHSAGKLSPLLQQSAGIVATRGEGCYLYSADGSRYLDFTSGIGVTNTGHCHPKVVEAVQKQAATLVHGQYTTVLHPGLGELSDKLCEKMPGEINRVFYANAGTEAVEGAVRLCRQATGRAKIIVFHGSFHGRTAGSLSMTTSKAAYRAGLEPLMSGIVVAPFPDCFHYGWDEQETTAFCLRELDRIFATYCAPQETAAMVIEPIQGEGGFIPANEAFLAGLRERCDQHGILLVLDEVQAGFGRTGHFWGHEHYGGKPDIVITAKGLASGFPLSAFAAPHDLMSQGWMGSQGGTYGGNAVACAAALATLDVIDSEGLVDNAAEQGKHLRQRLALSLEQYDCVAEVRGEGLMLGVVIVDGDGKPDGARAKRIIAAMKERGVLMLSCGPYGHVVRWLPPLIATREQIDEAADVFLESARVTET